MLIQKLALGRLNPAKHSSNQMRSLYLRLATFIPPSLGRMQTTPNEEGQAVDLACLPSRGLRSRCAHSLTIHTQPHAATLSFVENEGLIPNVGHSAIINPT